MSHVAESTNLNASPGDVWDLVGDFNSLPEWMPGIASSELRPGPGGVDRFLTLEDGKELLERLEFLDSSSMEYGYTIIESPLPIADYHARIKVSADGGGTTVDYTADFEAVGIPEEEAIGAISGLFQGALEKLREEMEGERAGRARLPGS